MVWVEFPTVVVSPGSVVVRVSVKKVVVVMV